MKRSASNLVLGSMRRENSMVHQQDDEHALSINSGAALSAQPSLSLPLQRQMSMSTSPQASNLAISPIHDQNQQQQQNEQSFREDPAKKAEPVFYSPSPVRQLLMNRNAASAIPPVRVDFGGPLACEVDVLSPAHFDSSKRGGNAGVSPSVLLGQMKDSYQTERSQKHKMMRKSPSGSSTTTAPPKPGQRNQSPAAFVKLTRQQQIQRKQLQRDEKGKLDRMRVAEEQRLLSANRDEEWEERRQLINARLYSGFGPQAGVFRKMFLEDDRRKRRRGIEAGIADRRRDNILVGRVPPPSTQPPIPREVFERPRFSKKTTVMDLEAGVVKEEEAEEGPLLEADEVEEIERAQFERTGFSPMFQSKNEYMVSVRRRRQLERGSSYSGSSSMSRSLGPSKMKSQDDDDDDDDHAAAATTPKDHPSTPPPSNIIPPLGITTSSGETPQEQVAPKAEDSLQISETSSHGDDDDDVKEDEAEEEESEEDEDADEIAKGGTPPRSKLPETYCAHVGELLREIRLSRPDIQRRQLARTMQQRGCELNNKRRLDAELRFEQQRQLGGAGGGGTVSVPELGGTGWNSANIDRNDPAFSATAAFIHGRRSRKTIQEQAMDDLSKISSNSYVDEVTDKFLFFKHALASEKRTKFTYDEIAASAASGGSPTAMRRLSQQGGSGGDSSLLQPRDRSRPLMLNSHELRRKKAGSSYSAVPGPASPQSRKKPVSEDHEDDFGSRRNIGVGATVKLGGKNFTFDESMRC